jgi:lipid-A-disaccharide synthase
MLSIFIISGEASGDAHGAHLLKLLKEQQDKDLTFFAMGSTKLADSGAKLIVDSNALAVVGFVEVLSKLRKIREAFKKLKAAVRMYDPLLVILIDYPGFNLRLAKAIKKINSKIRIIYYISPQIWAWRPKRIVTIKKYIDLMAVIFPFEVPLYQAENIPVQFVGHPLVGHVATTIPVSQQRRYVGLNAHSKIIGLMPGSRLSEIRYLLPVMLETAAMLNQRHAPVEFLLFLASSLTEEDLKPHLTAFDLNIHLIKGNTYDAISTCDVVIVASGTATLEIAMLLKPMVIIYKSSWFSFALAKRLVKISQIGLCNIIAGEMIVAELLQERATAENITEEVNKILENAAYRTKMIEKLNALTQHLIREQEKAESLPHSILKILELHP